MPNKRSDKKRTVTLSIPKSLIAEIDEIAAKHERSRSKLIELMLREEVAHYQTTKEAEKDTLPQLMAAEDHPKKGYRTPMQYDTIPRQPNAH